MAEAQTQTQAEDTPHFFIDTRPRVIQLPEVSERESLNVRYPLMPPYAFAHVQWDAQERELVYTVEEAQLSNTEKELLRLLTLGLEEMINISYTSASGNDVVLDYLEKNVRAILAELGAKVSKDSYLKLMYYIYRDFVGINEIEPLLNDPYIEDIECNGVGSPIYVVHRKYQNLRTSVKFEEASKLIDFVEKLAQKTGRYVSYAKPLLDGSLPDGSRVNATYTSDITTRGPTFTIRKFTKEPLTPVHLIKLGTTDVATFAFIWMAVEHKFNIMTIGETASGKTTFLNAIMQFVPGEARIVSIEDTRELNLAHENWIPAVERSGFGIPNLLGKQYGEISLFDLLKETFRQNPDYVIVGEVRGPETYVLFQGMASGHSSFSTFHAASVETLVRRLETPPINLPASLVNSLDIVISVAHLKDATHNTRRMIQLQEILSVTEKLGHVESNSLFTWQPQTDKFAYNGNSHIFKIISHRTGQSIAELEQELRRRAIILQRLVERGISNFADFDKVINLYYTEPQTVLNALRIA